MRFAFLKFETGLKDCIYKRILFDLLLQREDLLKNIKLALMSVYPLVILTFFIDSYWYWGFIVFLNSSFWLYWCPGYTYLSGWVGKAQIFEKYLKFFLVLGLINLLMFGATLALTLISTSIYNYVILGLTTAVLFLVLGFTVFLLKNVKVEPGVYIEHSLSKFKTFERVEQALKSDELVLQRAGQN